MNTLSKQLNYGILFYALIAFGLFSLALGKDVNWDLANYHYYVPYAFLHHRIGVDYWPSSNVTYLNPLIDMLPYFLINYFPPYVDGVVMGAIHGLNFWLLFRIAWLMQGITQPRHPMPVAFFLASLGMYAPQVMPELGLSMGDIFASIFTLASVYFALSAFLSEQDTQSFATKTVFYSGLVMGLGVGLKLTGVPFALGMCVAIMLVRMSWQNKIRWLSYWCLGGLIGGCITDGYWMILMWQKFHNPVYPFFNNIFHAAGAPGVNMRDTRFLPQGWMEALFYPFYFGKDGSTADVGFRDYRLAVVYLFVMLWALCRFLNKKSTIEQPVAKLQLDWLMGFYVASYVIWEIFFSIMRYAVCFEMLAPLLICLICCELVPQRQWRNVILGIFYYFIVHTMIIVYFGRSYWSNQPYWGVHMPASSAIVSQAMVVYPSDVLPAKYVKPPSPLSYLIPFFPKDWRFVGVNYGMPGRCHVAPELQQMVSNYKGPIYMMATTADLAALDCRAAYMGLQRQTPCERIPNVRDKYDDTLLCPAKKISLA